MRVRFRVLYASMYSRHTAVGCARGLPACNPYMSRARAQSRSAHPPSPAAQRAPAAAHGAGCSADFRVGPSCLCRPQAGACIDAGRGARCRKKSRGPLLSRARPAWRSTRCAPGATRASSRRRLVRPSLVAPACFASPPRLPARPRAAAILSLDSRAPRAPVSVPH